ncbi:MAG: hypothetical protein AAF184_06030 [Pseudomonadota bacterium]
MNVLNSAREVTRALDDALDARSTSQEEIGQLLDEILRTAVDADRRRHEVQRAEMQALEDAMDQALAQAQQEDEEIERILGALMTCSFGRISGQLTWSRVS